MSGSGSRATTREWAGRAAVCLIAAALVQLALPAGASADFQGTPGKIAYVDGLDGGGPVSSEYPLKIWDPADLTGHAEETLVGDTFHIPQSNEVVHGQMSAPSFSPDGTKIAFSRLVEDPGIPNVPGWHSAIFVINVDGTGLEQVTFPQAAVFPPPECEPPCIGHVVADFAPSWSPDGSKIAFIRQVAAGEADPLYGQELQNVWTVPAGGGSPTEITHGGTRDIYQSVVWAKTGMIAAAVEEGVGYIITRVGFGTPIAEPIAIEDWDVSPNGEWVTYTSPIDGVHVVKVDGSEETTLPTDGDGTAPVRFSPTGNGPLIFDCGDYTNRKGNSLKRCGVFEEHIEDPEGDIRSDDPPDRLLFPWTNFGGIVGGFSPTRAMWDVQAQQVPVIFVPGFLASNIKACGDTPWPPTFFNRNEMHEMDLLPNGETNDDCADAGPDGEPAGTILKTIALGGKIGIKDVTATLQEEMGKLKYPEQMGPSTAGTSEAGKTFPVSYFGWDWRKRAHDSVELLDEEITKVLEEGALQEKEGVDRVVLFGHSYGGLLIRTYEAEHPERVARILTVGTPYWGAPKVVFPLAFGRETPFFGLGLDLLTNGDQMQNLARNLAGLYELFPSAATYGPWLSIAGKAAGDGALRGEIEALGGQPTLYGKAQTDHEQTFDGFEDLYGQLDYQAVVGAGLPTPGSVNITPTGNGEAHVDVSMVNGDTTVPLRSADQGSIENPLGSRVHIQALCGVEHMSEPNDGKFLAAYKDWLLYDRTPRKLEGQCSDSGGVIELKSKDGVKLYSDEAWAKPAAAPLGGQRSGTGAARPGSRSAKRSAPATSTSTNSIPRCSSSPMTTTRSTSTSTSAERPSPTRRSAATARKERR